MAIKRKPVDNVIKLSSRRAVDLFPAGPPGPAGVGIQGPPGPKGPIGPMPQHQVSGNRIRFETAVGVWGKWIDLGSAAQITTPFTAGATIDSVPGLAEKLLELESGGVPYTRLIDTDGNYKYVGEAIPGSEENKDQAVWRIKRSEWTDSDDWEILWAEGTAEFDKIWDDRATYTYS